MLSIEELELIKERDKDKWASIFDLKQVNPDLLETVMDAAGFFCYDAVNLVFGNTSSTSGMYGSWHVSISLDCTVYLQRMAQFNPKGNGPSLEAALADFAIVCKKAETKYNVEKLNESR